MGESYQRTRRKARRGNRRVRYDGRLLLRMGWEVGGELVGCLFSGSTYLPGARQEPNRYMHGRMYAVSIPPFLSGWLQYRGQIRREFVQTATQTHFLC